MRDGGIADWFRLVFSSKSSVHGPRKNTRDHENNKHHKVNSFDLFFVDCSQDIVERGLLPQDVSHVVRFAQAEQDEPKNRKDKTSDGNGFSG